ncbi:MAG: hypothetical protein M0Z38_02580 [Deltaproteobacteria bacterium]|nr:hypothetical protein [Deltaproteobacteria bacterium]
MPEDKPNIYPPSIIDPLKPGGIPSPIEGATNAIEKCQHLAAEISDLVDRLPDPEGVAQDAYLGDLARDAETEQPCAACGKYTVKPGGFCPGCGAVR